ncbi:YkgJ family cysteine cluster protein [Ideonella sp.]|uniref:YkgJ family cysteine cluster protein n=1 Tax=Ideonella sp. TaxID=1929293 RepID=UPI003BB7A17D
MDCRPHCAACCIAPSISSAIPGMPQGKPANTRCVQLSETDQCLLFGDPRRPAVCGSLQPAADMCGSDRAHAMLWLSRLEQLTGPGLPSSALQTQAMKLDH